MPLYNTTPPVVNSPSLTVGEFAYDRTRRLIAGLQHEVGLVAGQHYQPRGHNSSRVVRLDLRQTSPSYLPIIRKNLEKLGMWAGLSDQDTGLRLGYSGLNIHIELPKPDRFWQPIDVQTLAERHYLRRGAVVTLGLGLQDEPVRLGWKDNDAGHVLIAGQTRSGKTNAQRMIAWHLARGNTPDDIRLIILDVAKRGYNWSDFSQIPHLAHPIVDNGSTAARALAYLIKEIDRRATSRRTKPQLFVFVDELKALIDDVEGAAALLSRVAAVGAEFGVFLVLATQHPQIKLLGNSELKRNLVTRLVGRTDDRISADNAVGLPGSGAERLVGRGDFLLRDRTSMVTRFTVARLDDQHVLDLPKGLPGVLDLPDEQQDERQEEALIMSPEQEAWALANWDSRWPLGIEKLRAEFGGGKPLNKQRQEQMIRMITGLRQQMKPGEVIDPYEMAINNYGQNENGA